MGQGTLARPGSWIITLDVAEQANWHQLVG